MFWSIVLYAGVMILIGFLGYKASAAFGTAAAVTSALIMCAVFGLALYLIGHRWWFCIALPLIPLLFISTEWSVSGKKAHDRICGAILAALLLVLALAAANAIVTNSAVKKDERFSALKEEFSFERGGAHFANGDYTRMEDEDFDITDFSKPYVFYYMDATGNDDNSAYMANKLPYLDSLFPSASSLKNVSAVVVAGRYNTRGKMYEKYVNGVYAGDTSISKNDVDLVFIDLDTHEYYELQGVFNGDLRDSDYYDSAVNTTKYKAVRKLRELYGAAG